MAPQQSPSPRSLPRSSTKGGNFTPRRSYARARASRERVDLLKRMEKNQKSQASFSRNVRWAINIICAVGIIGLLVYTFFLAPEPDNPSIGVEPPQLQR